MDPEGEDPDHPAGFGFRFLSEGGKVSTSESAAPVLTANSYVGLDCFEEKDAKRFFGREKLVEEFWNRCSPKGFRRCRAGQVTPSCVRRKEGKREFRVHSRFVSR